MAALSLVVGCAFKNPHRMDDARVRVTLDWLSARGNLPKELIKASRSLSENGSGRFESDAFVTLPVIAPDWVQLGVALPARAVEVDPTFAKAELTLEGKRYELPVELGSYARTGDLFTVGLTVGGLKATLPQDFSARAFILVELYSKEKRLVRVALKVRTPPSQVVRASEGVLKTRQQRKSGETGLIQPVLSGTQFNLVTSYVVTNSEDAPVELRLPRRIRGRFAQSVKEYRYRDLGCALSPGEAPAFENTESLSGLVQTDTLVLLPMDGAWILDAESYLSDEARLDDVVRTLKPSESLRIGLYAIGGGSDRWMSATERGSQVSQSTVPGGCLYECIEHTRPCGPRMEFCLVGEEALLGCVEWRITRRTSIEVKIGDAPLPPSLEFPEGAVRVRYRFAEFDANQDAELREMVLTESTSALTF